MFSWCFFFRNLGQNFRLILFCLQEEILSRSLGDIFLSDTRCIRTMANTNDEFDIQVSIRRKTSGAATVDCHFLPVVCIGRRTTHFLITFDSGASAITNNSNIINNNVTNETPVTLIDSQQQQPLQQQLYQQQQPINQNATSRMHQSASEPRGSIFSMRRGSFDVRSIASENIRRTSLAKLSALPLEAPITKVVSILSQVQESCSPDEAKLLDKVMEFLKREGLYSPQMKDMRTDDPVATDLIGALLTVSAFRFNRVFSNCHNSLVLSKDHRIRFHRDAVQMIRSFDRRQIDKHLFFRQSQKAVRQSIIYCKVAWTGVSIYFVWNK